MKKNTNYAIAYLAGYFDGDGCFHVRKTHPNGRLSPKFGMVIIVASVNRLVLEWFKYNYGGTIVTNDNVPNGQKSMHYYRLRKFKAVPLVKQMLPYIVEKREEAELFIDFFNSGSAQQRLNIIKEMKNIKNNENLISRHHPRYLKELKETITPTTTDYAYLAGFIDAECCFVIQKDQPKNRPNPTYKARLSFNDTKLPVFKWLMERFGGGLSFHQKSKYNKNYKDQLIWFVTTVKVREILKNVYPFLIHKKPVCEELMKFNDTILPNGGRRDSEAFKASYAKILKTRDEIVSNVHKLNLKGTNNT